jgi:HK97 family phage major capsid protein
MAEDVKLSEVAKEPEAKMPELAEVLRTLTAIQARQEQDALDREQVGKLAAEVTRLSEGLAKATAQRRAPFETTDATDILNRAEGQTRTLAMLTAEVSNDPTVIHAQEVLDRTYILCQITGKPAAELGYFRREVAKNSILKKTLDLANIANWQPSVFSQRMIEKVRLQLKVAALHQRIPMPADPYKFPVEGTDAVAYTVSEQAGVDAELTAGNRVTAGLTLSGATNITLTSKKIGTRVVTSKEVEEDSFVPILGYIEDKIALSMAEAQENICINGDTTTALDSGGGGYVTNDQRSAWHGYRKLIALKSGNSPNPKVTAGTSSALDISDLRQVRANMGKYAINPKDVVAITGPQGYIKVLGLAAGTNESPVQTIDKYGPQATIVTGELAKVDGVPLIVSEFVGPGNPLSGAENLNVSGIFDGTTTDFTEILYVRPSSLVFGDRRAATLKSKEVIETDQDVLVILQRLTFVPLYGTAVNYVGAVVGIAK